MINKENIKKRISDIDDEIEIHKIDLAKLEYERSIRLLLLEMDDDDIIEKIKYNYPADYDKYKTSKYLFVTYSSNNFEVDLKEKKKKSLINYNIYKDIYTLFQEFYRLYMYVKYEDNSLELK